MRTRALSTFNYIAKSSMTIATEGYVKAKLPEGVFYNPVQELNRDLTVAVIRQFEENHMKYWFAKESARKNNKEPIIYNGIKILEALAASGLRSVRFCREVPHIRQVVANDLDSLAADLIRENASLNSVEDILFASNCDAVSIMHSHKTFKSKFNVVDIDPYGTASPFLDAAVQCLHDHGLLCVTSTDMAVLCGSAIGTSMGKYGGVAIKCSAVHEQGLRLLLHAIQSAASRHGKVIEPVLALSIDFYARIYCIVKSNLGAVKNIATKAAMLYSCNGCLSHYFQPLGNVVESSSANQPERMMLARGPPVGPKCEECGSFFNVAGPMWYGPLHDKQFTQSVLDSLSKMNSDDEKNVFLPPALIDSLKLSEGVSKWMAPPKYGTLTRMLGLLTMASEELPDVPLYFLPDQLASIVKTPLPKTEELRSAILNAGYRVTESHCQKNAFKTDAPWSFIWEMMRIVRKKERQKLDLKNPDQVDDSPARAHILSKDLSDKYKIDFTLHPDADVNWKKKGVIRFQEKPPNWGPRSRARGDTNENTVTKKPKIM